MITSVERELKAAGYTTVCIVDSFKVVADPSKGSGTVAKTRNQPTMDLHVIPPQGAGLVGEGGKFRALQILDKAGITYDQGGVRVWGDRLIIPDLSNVQKKHGAESHTERAEVAERKD